MVNGVLEKKIIFKMVDTYNYCFLITKEMKVASQGLVGKAFGA